MLSTFLYMNKDKFVYVGSVDIIEVDCSKKHQILSEVYESDQRIRKSNELIKYAKEDHRNQELVISIIEKCGMPTLNEVTQKHMDAIWLGLQHSNKKVRKKYFPQVEKAVENGDLSKQQYALMKDRILMDEGKPQIYGSQIKNGKLYKLENPETVNERRQEMGLKPIEEYLKYFGIKYETN
ncbi:DUF6624 domain-containing protein [uncultured Tenacibaculum sp.]|uniref:DUF6624 domain-containing protein n=1 Tax=uncultured Tenacibaculum sp. TaxID=174713 RepID=UPI0026118CC7|nr:DUF6624 domain-containing protein [uncultured Tenacibaculum sp.]